MPHKNRSALNYLSIEELHKSFDERLLLNGVSFGINQGQKIALVGVNGCGKSTLMKIIAGREEADKGVVAFREGVKVAFVAQSPVLRKEIAFGRRFLMRRILRCH
ncbi:hypothetical protein PEDI_05280 [Persicobacter diffluens]|uniref:ABC transporter domain-containing protein n=1 Tax=Persicobacter diffluens TaxID=981 RepID=A0AAN4VU17_9BACT|nr:hypothetical protein PEDI_05280 [Persicobacter diffluens]